MPTYQCSNGHKFVHPAKQTTRLMSNSMGERDFLETSVCPICHSLEYSEYKEPEGEYSDWAKVSHEEVTAKLQAGWTVLSHTKDNVVMAKPKIVMIGIVGTAKRTLIEGLMRSATDIPIEEPQA
jgi:hypothetical protein